MTDSEHAIVAAAKWEQDWRALGEFAIMQEMERRFDVYWAEWDRQYEASRPGRYQPRPQRSNSRTGVSIHDSISYAELQKRRRQ